MKLTENRTNLFSPSFNRIPEQPVAKWSFPVGDKTAVIAYFGSSRMCAYDYEATMEVIDLMRRQVIRRDGAIWFPEI